MKYKTALILLGFFIYSTILVAAESDPSKIFTDVIEKYKSMKTYEAEGKITTEMDTEGRKSNIETTFSIKLKKPSLYLISWSQKMTPFFSQSGSLWNEGTQPYLYMGAANSYCKMNDDKTAIGSATGISVGAAFTIPSLFLSVFPDQSNQFSRLKKPEIKKIENIEGEDCYVISGNSDISKEETFWISKERKMIIKYVRSSVIFAVCHRD
ncbi:MAG: DUF2092 domain-containing protein [Acidobacteria bacterium]|nr:DUF2092 domain-containing protein [Acidobacteriota bacterium]MBI3657396.1 DUF2092 domain-containing protein [Acidobacteriota bacterium]